MIFRKNQPIDSKINKKTNIISCTKVYDHFVLIVSQRTTNEKKKKVESLSLSFWFVMMQSNRRIEHSLTLTNITKEIPFTFYCKLDMFFFSCMPSLSLSNKYVKNCIHICMNVNVEEEKNIMHMSHMYTYKTLSG